MDKLDLRKFLHTYIFICITIMGSTIIFLNVDYINNHKIVIMTFIINGLIIFLELSKSTKLGYSLKDTLFLFMFIFMYVSPLIQYIENKFPWWDTYLLTDERVLYTNFIIMTFLLVYILIYKTSYKNRDNGYKIKNNEIRNIRFVIDAFFLATVICSLYIIYKTGFRNLFVRSTNSLKIESLSGALIISCTFRSVPVVYVGLNLLYIIKNKKVHRKPTFLLGSILMLITNFPTATARFWMASVYLGLLIILKRKSKNRHLFKIVIFIGIMIIFPVINVFRYHTFKEVVAQGVYLPTPTDSFLSGNFDSYSMLVRSIIYVNLHGTVKGQQLLGNLLFFIPRKVWPSKPIGSGAMIASRLGWSFTNVSCPYIGEGYINFGVAGVILFAVILALISKWADSVYFRCVSDETKKVTFIELAYPFSIGFLFFALRGSLLSSISYYIGFMVPIILLLVMQKIELFYNKFMKV